MIHPDGLNSFDMGVWQEDDGSAYLIRSVNNEYLGISPLSPDYTTTLGLVSTAPRVCSWSIHAHDLRCQQATCVPRRVGTGDMVSCLHLLASLTLQPAQAVDSNGHVSRVCVCVCVCEGCMTLKAVISRA